MAVIPTQNSQVTKLNYTTDAADLSIVDKCFTSNFATDQRVTQSGSDWVQTGIVDATKNGWDADGYFYDAAGKQFDISYERTLERFGAEGLSDENAIVAATASGTKCAYLTDAVDYRINSTVALPKIDFYGKCAKFFGFNGTGFLLTESLTLCGEITFCEFGDLTQNQATNHDAAAFRFVPGSEVDHIDVEKGIKFERSRTGIRWVDSLANDYIIDQAGILHGGCFQASSEDMAQGALLIRVGQVDEYLIDGGSHKNTIGAGREIAPIQIYTDGIADDSPLYEQHGEIIATNVVIDTVINRTITGDSTPGNNYESAGMRFGGHDVTVTNNIISRVTGTNADCEGIYVKAGRTQVTDNTLYNSGTQEGAINVKGTDDVDWSLNPKGWYSNVSDNIIYFDEYVHNNAGTVVNLQRTGIQAGVPNGVSLVNNKVVGANEVDYMISGVPNSDNAGAFLHGNQSHNSRSSEIIQVRAACCSLRINDTTIIDPDPGDQNFYAIYVPPFTSRGNLHRDYEFSRGTIKMTNTSMSAGRSLSLLRLDGGAKDFDMVCINDWIFDVTANAQIRPIFLTTASGAVATNGTDIEAKRWKFHDCIDYSPVYSTNFRPLTFDFDFEFRREITTGTTTVFSTALADQSAVCSEFDAFTYRKDTPSIMGKIDTHSLFNVDGGNTTEIGTPNVTQQGNDSGITTSVVGSGDRINFNVTGSAGTHKACFHVRLKGENRAV